jgi:uncharacterized cupin superfamily protein
MTYTKVNHEDIEARADAMHFLRDPLDAEKLGLTVVDCEPGWTGMEYDHAEKDHEEIYYLTEGEATVVVEDEAVEMAAGDALRVSPDGTRRIENGDTASTFVLAGAP